MTIHNLAGETMATLVNEVQTEGRHQNTWDPVNLPSGIYRCRLQASSFRAVQRMMLMKKTENAKPAPYGRLCMVKRISKPSHVIFPVSLRSNAVFSHPARRHSISPGPF